MVIQCGAAALWRELVVANAEPRREKHNWKAVRQRSDPSIALALVSDAAGIANQSAAGPAVPGRREQERSQLRSLHGLRQLGRPPRKALTGRKCTYLLYPAWQVIEIAPNADAELLSTRPRAVIRGHFRIGPAEPARPGFGAVGVAGSSAGPSHSMGRVQKKRSQPRASRRN
jgi:hypothetical protein